MGIRRFPAARLLKSIVLYLTTKSLKSRPEIHWICAARNSTPYLAPPYTASSPTLVKEKPRGDKFGGASRRIATEWKGGFTAEKQ